MSAFTSDGTENRMRWDRTSPGFMEVWYATLNHRPSGGGLWVRYTITAPVRRRISPYCELWGFWFDPAPARSFGAKRRFSIDSLATDGRDDGAVVRLGEAWLAENHLEGEVERDGRLLQWSLDLDPADRTFHHLPAALRGRIEKRVSTICSPNLSVPFYGSAVLDGEKFDFDGDLGCQSHRWGRAHSHSWAWAHCSVFDGDVDATFEGVAARAGIGPVPLPTTTLLYLRYRGQDVVLNDIRSMFRTRGTYEMPTWAFTGYNDGWKIVGAARAPVDRAVQVRYEDPDGSDRYCANSEIGDIGIELYRKAASGWTHEASLAGMHTAHVEFGRRYAFERPPLSF